MQNGGVRRGGGGVGRRLRVPESTAVSESLRGCTELAEVQVQHLCPEPRRMDWDRELSVEMVLGWAQA